MKPLGAPPRGLRQPGRCSRAAAMGCFSVAKLGPQSRIPGTKAGSASPGQKTVSTLHSPSDQDKDIEHTIYCPRPRRQQAALAPVLMLASSVQPPSLPSRLSTGTAPAQLGVVTVWGKSKTKCHVRRASAAASSGTLPASRTRGSATPEDTAKTWLLPILMILAPRANQRPPPPFPQDPEPVPDHRPRPRPLLPRLPSTCPLFDPFWNPQVASPRQPYCIAPFLVCLPQIIKLHPAAARERSTPYLSSSSVSRPRPPRLGPAKPDDVVLQMWDDAVISGGWAGSLGGSRPCPLLGANLASFWSRHVLTCLQLMDGRPAVFHASHAIRSGPYFSRNSGKSLCNFAPGK